MPQASEVSQYNYTRKYNVDLFSYKIMIVTYFDISTSSYIILVIVLSGISWYIEGTILVLSCRSITVFDDGSAQFTFFQDLVLKRTDSNSTNVTE